MLHAPPTNVKTVFFQEFSLIFIFAVIINEAFAEYFTEPVDNKQQLNSSSDHGYDWNVSTFDDDVFIVFYFIYSSDVRILFCIF